MRPGPAIIVLPILSRGDIFLLHRNDNLDKNQVSTSGRRDSHYNLQVSTGPLRRFEEVKWIYEKRENGRDTFFVIPWDIGPAVPFLMRGREYLQE